VTNEERSELLFIVETKSEMKEIRTLRKKSSIGATTSRQNSK